MGAAGPIAGVDLIGETGPIQPGREIGEDGVRDVNAERSDTHGYIHYGGGRDEMARLQWRYRGAPSA